MKNNFFIRLLTSSFLLIGCLANSASAGGITDTSNNSFIDDTTGLEWIDFGINDGRSYNDVVNGLEYAGWSIANKQQVFTLWENIFYSTGPEHTESCTEENKHSEECMNLLMHGVYSVEDNPNLFNCISYLITAATSGETPGIVFFRPSAQIEASLTAT